jgi:hypothetical protein
MRVFLVLTTLVLLAGSLAFLVLTILALLEILLHLLNRSSMVP